MKLQEKYEKEIKKVLESEFGIANPLAIPKIIKVVVNMGMGQVAKNSQALENLKKDLCSITGQVPSLRTAKVSVAGFNLRKGMPVGFKVTLRGGRMYCFLERLIGVVLPRLRDFRGMPLKGFDRGGNYTLGLSEHTVFPEIDISKSLSHGVEITIVTNAYTLEKSKRLLELMGMPFEKR